MPINVTPVATLDDRINDIRLRTARIVNEEILPHEAGCGRPARRRARRGRPGRGPEPASG